MRPMARKRTTLVSLTDGTEAAWPKRVAPARPMPGQPKPKKVERMNQKGKRRNQRAKPTKMLSP
ncbi:MAG: hypothetical protein UY33_C0032G0021 [Candidatus Amesbacteria bacterium GW2011_GWA1_48_9]|uniref:Uncharacterized protein n=1 Tax=Candidatus Amesbacteria bacterium GW2011_GWA1_48_9 TaxID=1618355 RepID=A0A0G1UZ52_9BACT|nr:MAG: hypothetical protein UY33_C0032G0021 [Candidatus Amesbacteria bacterium GW2011_GWA1_48_9]